LHEVIAMIRIRRIRMHERGLVFRDKALMRVLGPGWHVIVDPLLRVRIDRVSVRDAWLRHADLDVIAKSGLLGDAAVVLDLAENERALVWIDRRLAAVLRPGLAVLWTAFRDVRVERIDAGGVRFEHASLHAVLAVPSAREALESVDVEAGHAGVYTRDGRHEATLRPGTHAFWRGVARVKVAVVDLREQVQDVAGQELMTADKVTLRLNAVVVFRVVDPLLAVTAVEDHRQALYREAQLSLRAAVGARELDALLQDKDAVARELDGVLKARAAAFGVELVQLGIRDVILPGEMKDLMNKVTEAKKAAEANLITRREEIAAMRSQANTARIFETNPTLMRLKELEVLEKVAGKANLQVIVGEKGLTDRVVKLL
jgi:regulator of protease activity HflC (stomatin/prohibitin superfamily)